MKLFSIKLSSSVLSVLSVLSATSGTLAQGTATQLPSRPVISLQLAERLADSCQEWARQRNLRVTVAVHDAGANLLLFRRMDGAPIGSIELVIAKARTSALFPYPTHEWQTLVYGAPGQEAILRGVEHAPSIAIFGGGVPIITAKKVHIGGMAVGGIEPKQETECGNYALAAAADVLSVN